MTQVVPRKKQQKVSVEEYVEKHNPILNRRQQKMSYGYVYRLIREDIKGTGKRKLWFKYTLEGDKDRIFIIVDKS